MGKYKVIQPLKSKNKVYMPGDTVELNENTAKHIPKIVVPIPDSMEVEAELELPAEQEVIEKVNPNKKAKGK